MVLFNGFCRIRIKSLPNKNYLYWTKLKGFGDDKLNFNKIMISFLHRVENIVGRGDNVGNQVL